MSLERLIELAKHTGDKLIVHDPIEGHDVVIMDIDAYEDLIMKYDSRVDIPTMDLLEELHDTDTVSNIYKDSSPWHSAGSVLGSQYKDSDDWSKQDDFDEDEDIISDFEDWDTADLEEELSLSSISHDQEISFGADTKWEEDIPEVVSVGSHNTWESSPQEPVLEPVPFTPVGELSEPWQEEPLATDEPVFYEEPV